MSQSTDNWEALKKLVASDDAPAIPDGVALGAVLTIMTDVLVEIRDELVEMNERAR
jgi:hypothetical protein